MQIRRSMPGTHGVDDRLSKIRHSESSPAISGQKLIEPIDKQQGKELFYDITKGVEEREKEQQEDKPKKKKHSLIPWQEHHDLEYIKKGIKANLKNNSIN